MEAVLKQMLLGTAKMELPQGAPNGAEEGGRDARPTVAPVGDVDELMAFVEPQEAEARLLLAAGAWTVFAQAGRKPLVAEPLPKPAPEEDQPIPSARAAGLLAELFTGEHRDLLPEALACLREAGLRLPDDLLPVALDDREPRNRPYIAEVLGARGRWLSAFNEDWSWATGPVAHGDDRLPQNAEELWDAGTIDEREAVLRRLRRLEPARAREWLQRSWPGEKAEHRCRLLGVLGMNLSGDDEGFLEEALADRAMRVRAKAATLLVRIAGSALRQRIYDRVNPCLTYRHAAVGKLSTRLKALVGRRSEGELTAAAPEDVEATWKNEGIIPAPPQGVGPRAWWLSRMLGLIPPEHWRERFGLGPAELAAVAIADEWETPVVAGWTQAAMLHEATEWLPALWDRWMGTAGLGGDDRLMDTDPAELLGPMLARMKPEDSTPRIERLIRENRVAPFGWFRALEHIAWPWSPTVSRAYLEHVRRRAGQAAQVANVELQSLALAARALSSECFEEAIQGWAIAEGDDYLLQSWRREVDRFTEVVRLRQRLAREIGGQ